VATYITDVIDIPDLIGYVRESAVLTGDTLESILPVLEVPDIEFELENLESPLLQIARYRSWDAPVPLGKRPGLAVIRGEIAPFGLAFTLNEKELARFEALRQGASNLGNPDGAAAQVGRDIYNDALEAGRACTLRYEQARADLLLDGKVTINENGFATEADFGIPGGHIVTAGIAWSDRTNSIPVTNLLAYEATYRAANGGRNPDAWVMSDEVIGDVQNNAQVKAIYGREVNGAIAGIVPKERLADVFRIAGIKAPIVPFNGQLPDTAGTGTTPTIPVRKVIAVRQGMGNVLFGTHAAANVLVRKGIIQRRDAAGIIAYAVEDVHPVRVTTVAEAVGLPVLRDPKALFVATV
jgi:hypothetical protein